MFHVYLSRHPDSLHTHYKKWLQDTASWELYHSAYTIPLVCKGGCIQWRWSASDVEGDPEDLSQCWVPGLSLRSPCPAPQYCSDVNKSLAVKSDVGSSGNKANSSIALSEGATVSMHGTHCDNTIVFCLRLRISSL